MSCRVKSSCLRLFVATAQTAGDDNGSEVLIEKSRRKELFLVACS
jgi:hypothetical protein